MIIASELKKGTTLSLDNKLLRVTGTVYNKPGRGNAQIRATMVDIATGITSQRTFGIEERLDNIFVEAENCEYLYGDEDFLHFMNTTSFDQYEVPRSLFDSDVFFLKEGMQLELRVYEGRPIDYVLPTTMIYDVVDSENAVAGDTAGSVLKQAITDTGLKVQVPLFVNVGDKIKVDTRDGSYSSRA
ncbi:MAG: elongation factor P [Phototrophicaceae bacterium]|jgi:elongation factor P